MPFFCSTSVQDELVAIANDYLFGLYETTRQIDYKITIVIICAPVLIICVQPVQPVLICASVWAGTPQPTRRRPHSV